jgi:hypothetical protein
LLCISFSFLCSMHLFENRLMFNLICEFFNYFLHESLVHYIILVPKKWKLHQIFKFIFWNFDIYLISRIFLKLYKGDATTTPMASCRLFVIVEKRSHVLSSIKIPSNDIQINNFYIFYILFIRMSLFYNFDEDGF